MERSTETERERGDMRQTEKEKGGCWWPLLGGTLGRESEGYGGREHLMATLGEPTLDALQTPLRIPQREKIVQPMPM